MEPRITAVFRPEILAAYKNRLLKPDDATQRSRRCDTGRALGHIVFLPEHPEDVGVDLLHGICCVAHLQHTTSQTVTYTCAQRLGT